MQFRVHSNLINVSPLQSSCPRTSPVRFPKKTRHFSDASDVLGCTKFSSSSPVRPRFPRPTIPRSREPNQHQLAHPRTIRFSQFTAAGTPTNCPTAISTPRCRIWKKVRADTVRSLCSYNFSFTSSAIR